MKSIILLGMKHVGKSSIGRILAKAFELPFYDLDHQLIKKARPGETGATAREIYRKEGLEGFQFWEKAAAQELAGSQKAMILALGGGTIENQPVMEILGNIGIFVYLQEKPEPLFERIQRGGIPPFLDQDHPWESFLELYKERTAMMDAQAEITVALSGAGVKQSAEKVIARIKEGQHAR
jgi:shikimate kinase